MNGVCVNSLSKRLGIEESFSNFEADNVYSFSLKAKAMLFIHGEDKKIIKMFWYVAETQAF